MPVCAYACVRVCVVCASVCAFAYVRAFACVRACVRAFACVCACVRACVHAPPRSTPQAHSTRHNSFLPCCLPRSWTNNIVTAQLSFRKYFCTLHFPLLFFKLTQTNSVPRRRQLTRRCNNIIRCLPPARLRLPSLHCLPRCFDLIRFKVVTTIMSNLFPEQIYF
jgi:hypothetical protein